MCRPNCFECGFFTQKKIVIRHKTNENTLSVNVVTHKRLMCTETRMPTSSSLLLEQTITQKYSCKQR